MKKRMIATRANKEIRQPVIGLHFVDVVDDFISTKVASDEFFYDNAMTKNDVIFAPKWMSLVVKNDVATDRRSQTTRFTKFFLMLFRKFTPPWSRRSLEPSGLPYLLTYFLRKGADDRLSSLGKTETKSGAELISVPMLRRERFLTLKANLFHKNRISSIG